MFFPVILPDQGPRMTLCETKLIPFLPSLHATVSMTLRVNVCVCVCGCVCEVRAEVAATHDTGLEGSGEAGRRLEAR